MFERHAKYPALSRSALLLIVLGLFSIATNAHAVPPALGVGAQLTGTSLANEPIIYTEANAHPVVRIGLGMTAHLTVHLIDRWGLRVSGGYSHFLISGERFVIPDDNYIPQDGEARVRTHYDSYQTAVLLLYSLDSRHYFLFGPNLQRHDYRTVEEGEMPTDYIDIFDEYSAVKSWREVRGGFGFGVGRRMTQRTTLEVMVNIDNFRSEIVLSYSILAPLRFFEGSGTGP